MSLPSLPPLVELHLHIEGTLEPELIFRLAERNGLALPYSHLDELRERYRFTDLQSFLDLYYANMAVLQTEDDFADLTRAYLVRAHRAGVRHAEIFFDPQAHTVRGIPLEVCVSGIARGTREAEAETGITSTLIANFLRDQPVDDALATLQALLALGAPIIGVGLDSAEVGHPPADFAPVFDLARENGLHLVAHAGEEGPPSYVWEALQTLGVTRIDHGIRSLEDAALVDHLASNSIPLTVCPLSNVRLRVVDSIAEHPLPRMLASGLAVCINSDDPAYFGGYIDDNLVAVQEAFDLSPADLALLARNSVRASFLDDSRKAELDAAIDDWLGRQA